MPEQDTVLHLCVTCGRLKTEESFEEGDCTCQDCHREGRSAVNYVENPDGEGWIPNE